MAAQQFQYIVTARGRPWRSGEFKRIDALARTVRAALSKKGSAIHVLFEEESGKRALLTLKFEFMGHECPWGSPNKATSEKELSALLNRLQAGETIQGTMYRCEKLENCMQSVLAEGFDEVWALEEAGDQLLGVSEESCVDVSARVLVALGCVRDMDSREKNAFIQACKERHIPYRSKSLGSTPELTSKCIKCLERCNDLKFLSASRCLPAGGKRTPLHFVLHLNESLPDFSKRPVAGTVLVDAFISSHDVYDDTTLSLVGNDNTVVTMQRPRCSFLSEEDALKCLERKLAYAMRDYTGLVQVVQDLKQSFLFHADSDGTPLKCVADGLVANDHDAKPVVVVFAPLRLREDIRKEGASAAAYAHVALGNLQHGIAFVQMLHNEGFWTGAARSSGYCIPITDKMPDHAESPTVTRCSSMTSLVESFRDLTSESSLPENDAELDASLVSVNVAAVAPLAEPTEHGASSADKRQKALQKKLRQIQDLERKWQRGDGMNPAELAKIALYPDLLAEFEKLSGVDKRKKALQKKLRQIEDLKQKQQRGDTMNPDELAKIALYTDLATEFEKRGGVVIKSISSPMVQKCTSK